MTRKSLLRLGGEYDRVIAYRLVSSLPLLMRPSKLSAGVKRGSISMGGALTIFYLPMMQFSSVTTAGRFSIWLISLLSLSGRLV
jgi:hypothetical protein